MRTTKNQLIEWERAYQKLLFKFLRKFHTFNGSDVCTWMRKQGFDDPFTHNVWVCQIAYYGRIRTLMRPIGYEQPSRSSTPQSHLSSIRRYESQLYKG